MIGVDPRIHLCGLDGRSFCSEFVEQSLDFIRCLTDWIRSALRGRISNCLSDVGVWVGCEGSFLLHRLLILQVQLVGVCLECGMSSRELAVLPLHHKSACDGRQQFVLRNRRSCRLSRCYSHRRLSLTRCLSLGLQKTLECVLLSHKQAVFLRLRECFSGIKLLSNQISNLVVRLKLIRNGEVSLSQKSSKNCR